MARFFYGSFFLSLLILKPLFAADDLGAYASVAGTIVQNMTNVESGTRGGGKIEFARLDRWVSMDLRAASGNHVVDYGFVLKLYKHWHFSDSMGATGLSLGAGPVLLYSTGVDNGDFANGTATREGNKRAFMDLGMHPFMRFLYDTSRGFGFVADVGVDMIFSRRYSSSPDELSSNDKRSRYRVVASLGFAFPVD